HPAEAPGEVARGDRREPLLRVDVEDPLAHVERVVLVLEDLDVVERGSVTVGPGAGGLGSGGAGRHSHVGDATALVMHCITCCYAYLREWAPDGSCEGDQLPVVRIPEVLDAVRQQEDPLGVQG